MLNPAAIITGASSGIGAATAIEFARNKYDLLLIGRNSERLALVQKDCLQLNPNIKVEVLSMDLKNYVSQAFLQKVSEFSNPTVLVNNAGIYDRHPIEDTTKEIWLEQFSVNLLGPVQMTQDLWSIFKKNKLGSIVNVSSTLGITPIPMTSAYSAIKAAMINWTKTLACEGGEFNIRANCVCPGIIDTPMHPFHSDSSSQKKTTEKSIHELQLLKKTGQPIDIARAIYFLASEQSSWTTGTVISVDGGIDLK